MVARGPQRNSLKRRIRSAEIKPSRPSSLPPVPDPAPHERDATAFWFRRFVTSLAIGNGAGLIGLSSYVGGSEDVPSAAAFAFHGFSYFLSGLAFAFASLFISLLWTAFRLDAFGEYFSRFEKTVNDAKKAGKPIELGDAWSARPVVYTFAVIFFLSQIALIISSGGFFYAGSASVLSGIAQAACSKNAGAGTCPYDATFPFFTTLATGGESDRLVTVVGSSTSHGDPSEHWVRSLRIAPTNEKFSISSVNFEQRVRLSSSDDRGQFVSCYLDVPLFLLGDALSYDRRKEADALINFASHNAGAVDVRPAELFVSIFLDEGEELAASTRLAITAGPDGTITVGNPIDRSALVQSAMRDHGAGMLAIISDDVTNECRSLITASQIEALQAGTGR